MLATDFPPAPQNVRRFRSLGKITCPPAASLIGDGDDRNVVNNGLLKVED